ncbi:hypothetical protein BLA24_08790 [Streptomyces cinnamoneus]|uniref:Uncharacterized protein n=1 Tax=Streptomyces cinnamoneus TaxID=53446 RepID=A0A2G1XLY4_STRCJ|nr:DUF742 domain-containing protein [Streptomyces cinnamoneus]PHQ52248.1 hypothetical protein BLA24_08790 [Streptomyces cinnamoneus]PPT12181.1 DUF742 domain-containing protein [Streptomyces cinnamoneus]
MSKAGKAWDPGNPDRLYIVTSGRAQAGERARLDLVTLVVARSKSDPGLQPEHSAIVQMCDYPLSIAEISAYLTLPVSTVTVLVTDLLKEDQVEARPPVPVATLPNVQLLEAVMHGLQNL